MSHTHRTAILDLTFSLLVLLLSPVQYPFEGTLIAELSSGALRDGELSSAVLADVGYFKHISFSFSTFPQSTHLPATK